MRWTGAWSCEPRSLSLRCDPNPSGAVHPGDGRCQSIGRAVADCRENGRASEAARGLDRTRARRFRSVPRPLWQPPRHPENGWAHPREPAGAGLWLPCLFLITSQSAKMGSHQPRHFCCGHRCRTRVRCLIVILILGRCLMALAKTSCALLRLLPA